MAELADARGLKSLDSISCEYDTDKVVNGLKQKNVGITFPSYPNDETQFVPIDEAINVVKQGYIFD